MTDSFHFLFPKIGNQQTVSSFMNKIGLTESQEASKSSVLILNGVGHVDAVLANEKYILEILTNHLKVGGKVLAICLGMQALFSSNEESRLGRALGLFPGRVIMIPEGLNVGYKKVCTLDGYFEAYFQNLYGVPIDDEIEQFDKLETYEVNNTRYLASFEYGNIMAFQYHPELSGKTVANSLATKLGCLK